MCGLLLLCYLGSSVDVFGDSLCCVISVLISVVVMVFVID